ncbi:unnamed protein product [marine sediment metagenome]|uniref:Uncharacterized protein n=1 Tax=marine sediment metagenome TaxID=412755 RepID=X1SEB0_9ZZZZ
MKNPILVFGFITTWIIFGGLLTLAIIFDGVFIQLVFDFSILIVSGLIGYLTARKISNSK